jgi:hypothetical protein
MRVQGSSRVWPGFGGVALTFHQFVDLSLLTRISAICGQYWIDLIEEVMGFLPWVAAKGDTM